MKQQLEQLTSSIEMATQQVSPRDNKREYREELRRILEQDGWVYLGKGLSRIVFISKDNKYVLKVDMNASQNKPEIEVYAKIPKKLRKYFLKPIAHDTKNFRWILTHVAKTYNDGLTYAKSRKIVDKLTKVFRNNLLAVHDLHCSNIGVYRKQICMVDYGWGIDKIPK